MTETPKPRQTLVFPIQLEDRFMAQLVLPMDMSRTEMLRLRRLLWTLAVPWRDRPADWPERSRT